MNELEYYYKNKISIQYTSVLGNNCHNNNTTKYIPYDNCDPQILKYLYINDIINLILVNKSLNNFIISTQIYSELIQIIKLPRNKILINCYKKGLINVLKNYHYLGGQNILFKHAIDYASQNGHVQILEWFKNTGFMFKYSNYAIDFASENGAAK